MRIHLLGTAAGGGLPQWNCACLNCQAARANPLLHRSQTQVAISETGIDWVLLNASPDLRDQLFRAPYLHPIPERGIRNIPVAGVVLTSADLDQILGLLLLREFTPVSIYATPSVLSVLEANPFFAMLDRVSGQKRLHAIHDTVIFCPLAGVKITPLALEGNVPAYVPAETRGSIKLEEMTTGLILESVSGKRAAFLPAVSSIPSDLVKLIGSCDVLLIDGTVWSEDELPRMQPGTPTASSMGHIPIGGEHGSLAALKEVSHVRRIYTHINNSNPILREGSEEQRSVLDAGVEISYDGMVLEL